MVNGFPLLFWHMFDKIRASSVVLLWLQLSTILGKVDYSQQSQHQWEIWETKKKVFRETLEACFLLSFIIFFFVVTFPLSICSKNSTLTSIMNSCMRPTIKHTKKDMRFSSFPICCTLNTNRQIGCNERCNFWYPFRLPKSLFLWPLVSVKRHQTHHYAHDSPGPIPPPAAKLHRVWVYSRLWLKMVKHFELKHVYG